MNLIHNPSVPCTCTIEWDATVAGTVSASIRYCPLHVRAPALAEALGRIAQFRCDAERFDDSDECSGPDDPCSSCIARAALALVDGAE